MLAHAIASRETFFPGDKIRAPMSRRAPAGSPPSRDRRAPCPDVGHQDLRELCIAHVDRSKDAAVLPAVFGDHLWRCLLYTSDAADDLTRLDLDGLRISIV